VLDAILRDLSTLYSIWQQSGGITETFAGLLTFIMLNPSDSELRRSESPFIRSLAGMPRAERRMTASERQAALDRVDLFLGELHPW
jgi:hypothetical protein